MEYKKGSTVEVLVSDGLVYNSWRCAQIVSGNRHTYILRYNMYSSFTNKANVERVFAKSIRPCPPLLEISECWAPGDIVEVFHNLTWKPAVDLKDLDWDKFLVRATGIFQDFEVTKAELRVRQSYQNDEWIIIDKVSKDYQDANCTNCLSPSHGVSSNTLNQASSCCYSQDEAYEERSQKFRVCEEEESVKSSTGSCSGHNYKPYEVYHGSGPLEDTERHESDAESVYRLGYHEETGQSPTNEVSADDDHRREWSQYRSTMEALYASGPLSWEKETMITNLRMKLHISNDEHLIMLKSLKSAASNSLCR